MLARSLLVAGFVVSWALAAEAQFPQQQIPGQMVPQSPRQQQRQMQQMQAMQAMQGMPFQLAGTIETFAANRVQIADPTTGMRRIVTLNPQTIIKTTGEATVGFLHPGLAVEFKGEIDKKGNVTDKVGELTIVSITKEKLPGVFKEDGSEIEKPLAVAAKKDKEKEKDKDKAASSAGTSTIVGQLKSAKAGKYQLQAGRVSLQFELSDDAKITIDMADGSLAMPGDKIDVKGVQIGNPANPQSHAREVAITLAETRGEKKDAKADAKRPPKTPRPKKDKDADAAGLPAPAEDR
jgi:hypothetical protein